MSDIFNLLRRLKKKVIEPKIYAIVFHDYSGSSSDLKLHLTSAYTLDDAVMSFLSPKEKPASGTWRPMIWATMDLQQLTDNISMYKGFVEDSKSAQKRELMRIIIESGDLEMLEKNKKKFTNAEKKYIKERVEGNNK